MDPIILIGIVGSVASIVSLFLAKPDLKSRVIHAAYSLFIVIIAGSAVVYNGSVLQRLEKANSETQQLQEKLFIFQSRTLEAKKLLDARGYSSTDDTGKNRGFILAGFSFLEKNRLLFPDMYELVKKMSDGAKITQFSGNIATQEYYDEKHRMADAAEAMAGILRGIAGRD
jgi:hypothetical protein